MEEGIDLRPYIEIIFKRWYWILGISLVAAVAAFAISSFLSPTYKATALVAVTQQRELLQFDPRIRSVEDEEQPLKAYPELAYSDELLQVLLEEMGSTIGGIDTVTELRGILKAESGSDPSLVRLSARYGDPDHAAEIANLWAESFVQRANSVFGVQNGTQVEFFEDQLKQSKKELVAAEEALVAFQRQNRAAITENQLLALSATQADYLSDQQALALLIQDVQGLRDQLNEQNNRESASLADQLTALSLQLKAFNAAFDSETAVPLQLQINATDDLANATRGDQIASLDALAETLESRLEQIDDALAKLEPKILTLQEEKQAANAENARRVREMTLAEETYLALARKVDEEKISSDEISSGVRLASTASVPDKPVSPKKIQNAIFAGALTFFLVTAGLFLIFWWRRNGEESVTQPSKPETS